MSKLTALLSLLLFSFVLHAQNDETRRLIDLDRRSIPFNSQQALEKSREYIRKDSTYYIGYMYEGAYKFNRANDELGFRQAIVPLKKAFDLIEKEYDTELRTRTNDLIGYLAVNVIQNDYSYIANWLEGCYQNIEQADKAYEVLIHVRDRDLQYESAVDSWNTLAWLYHRNRMYTSEKFPFLLNSVHANDSMAYDCLDSAIAKTNRDIEINQGLFDPTFMNSRYYYTYHYKVILFTYDFELDSADFYYEILLNSGYYSSNNYANYQYMKGEFGIAEAFYKEAEERDATTDKHTREYFYMRGLLEIYRGTPQHADSLLSGIIAKDGFTPGYGWHCIAYARAMMYEGLTTASQEKVNSAARFEELHIGTTWGQEQYNLGVATLNYINALHFESEYYFENDQWYFWLNPVNWYNWLEHKIKVHHFRLVVVSLIASNPERAEVLYPVFSSENILGWDENWQLLDGFSNQYFIDYYERLLQKDPRDGVKNYIRFILARLYISEGDEDSAKAYLNEIIAGQWGSWNEFDRLLHARTCEALAMCADGAERQDWLMTTYSEFPQLIPFSDASLEFRVEVDGEVYMPNAEDYVYRMALFSMIAIGILSGLYFLSRRYFRFRHSTKWIVVSASGLFSIALIVWMIGVFGQDKLSNKEIVLDNFSNCNIDFGDKTWYPTAEIDFEETDSTSMINYVVFDGKDSLITKGSIVIDPDRPDQTGKILAYRLFKIEFEYVKPEIEAEEVAVDAEPEGAPVQATTDDL